jgi:hypothetical protein
MSVLKRTARRSVICALLLCEGLLYAQKAAAPEYRVKAVFLYNFTNFIEWPASAFSAAKSPFVVGILGKDPFGSYLEEAMSGESANGHPLIIQRYKHVNEISNCHILFIHKGEADKIAAVISGLKGRNTLIVSDAPEFIQQGGMIRFLTKAGKIQLQINLPATQAAKLEISSKLLRY